MEVSFAQSARRHRVGRARVRAVVSRPEVLVELSAPPGGDDRLVFLGDDGSGRVLEVMAVRVVNGLLVIHAMDIRPKWRAVYEEAIREQ